MNRINYLTKKVKQKFQLTLFTESSKLIQVIKRQLKTARPKKIGFYLDNPLFIHLGDQLFFEPALRLISREFDTYIRPTSDMVEYFIKSGAKVITDEKIFDCDVIVTRNELLSEVLLKTKIDIISVNTLSDNMQHRVSEAIAYSLAQYFEIEIPGNFDFAPWKPSAEERQVAADKVLLAPYVDSGWFRVWSFDVYQLSLYAKKFAKDSGFSICLVGGKSDAESKISTVIGTNFEDWRGQFSPCQFMQLLASGRIARVFTFDTFVFHAAVASAVPVTVKIRRSLPKKTRFIRDHFLPSYFGLDHQIDFLQG
jgi:hypothetical protein